MYCTDCERKLPDDAVFCCYCGRPVKEAEKERLPETTELISAKDAECNYTENDSIKLPVTAGHVIIEDGTASIGNYMLCGHAEIKSVTIPDSVKKIGRSAFSGCKSLTEINLPPIDLIDAEAFRGCSGLTEVKLPDTVSCIWGGAFRECTNLARINLPASLEFAGENIFKDCTSLKEVIVPKKVYDRMFDHNFRKNFGHAEIIITD